MVGATMPLRTLTARRRDHALKAGAKERRLIGA